ncbi:MAG: 50S ribosomal protein L21e [Methanomassiliicoccales archaeon]
MVKASHGPRKKSRNLLRKSPRSRGLSPITHEFQEFEVGEKVHIYLDPSIHHGMPALRFHGKTGTVIGMQGRAFVLAVKDGDKVKTVLSTPEHLRKSA